MGKTRKGRVGVCKGRLRGRRMLRSMLVDGTSRKIMLRGNNKARGVTSYFMAS